MMKTLVFLQVQHRAGLHDDARLCEPLDIGEIPRQGDFIWFNDETHHCSGYGKVVRVDHDFFGKEGIQLIRITCENFIDNSVEFYIDWPDADTEGAEPSPLWKSVGDDYWTTAHAVRVNP